MTHPLAMKLPLTTSLAAGLLAASGAHAQQFVTDDAAITDRGACQLEAWYGEAASWVLPACHFVREFELTGGIGFVNDGEGRSTEYVLQGKYLLREMTSNSFGVGVVAGLGYDPLAQVAGGVHGVFAYVPVSFSWREDRLILHGNLGWHLEREDHGHDHHHGRDADPGHHALTWAARADLLIPLAGGRFSAIGEVFGEDRFLPGYQIGVPF
jgi:hypothetical protein